MGRFSWRIASAAALLAAAGTACTHGRPPHAGGLTIVQTQPIALLLPGRENGAVAQETASLLGRYLVTLDAAGGLVPDAAAVVPSRENGGISPDGRTIVYHLKPGLRFSDGAVLGAADAAATIEALRDPRSLLPSRLGIEDVAAVRATGALTLRVTLKRPYAPILLYLCAPGNATTILRSSQAQALDDPQASPASLAGAGPYAIAAVEPGERLELQPNRWYSPRPALAAMTIRTTGTSQTAHVELQSGEADGYVMADPALAGELADVPGLAIRSTPVDGIGALIFNTRSPVVSRAAMRRALLAGLDVAGDVRRIFRGGVSAHDAAAGLFLWAYDRRALPPPRYEPAAARSQLDALGWRLGRDGKRYRDGVPLALHVIVRGDQPSSSELAIEFAAQLRSLGVGVELRQYPIDEWGSPGGPLYGGAFDIAIAQFIAGFDPDVTDQFACDRIPPRGYNKPRYCNPALDAILARAAASYDRGLRRELYRQAQRILARDVPLVPLYRLVSLDALPAALHGVDPTAVSPFYGVARWSLR